MIIILLHQEQVEKYFLLLKNGKKYAIKITKQSYNDDIESHSII